MATTDESCVVYLDFDGTIADVDGRIPERTRRAILEARNRGHYVFLNTGRSPREIPSDVKDIGFDGYVTAGGAFAEVGDKVVHRETIPPAQVEAIIDALEKHDLAYTLQYFDGIYASPGLVELFSEVFNDRGFPVEPEDFVSERSTESVAKAVFASRDLQAYDKVCEELGPDFMVVTGTMPYMGTGSGEVSVDTFTKAAPFAAIAEELGVPLENTIAIGDASNDVAMLQRAGIGAAMGHASDEVIAVADEVTSSLISDGVHEVFVRHGLIGVAGKQLWPCGAASGRRRPDAAW